LIIIDSNNNLLKYLVIKRQNIILYRSNKNKTKLMVTIISLSILAVFSLIISMGLFIIGLVKKDGNCTWFGVVGLLILIAMISCYFMEWLIPMIVVIGSFGTALTLMGTSGEESEDSYKFGVIYLCIGLFLFFNAFLLWFQTGHYTSMAFTAWFFCITFVINIMNCDVEKYTPKLSFLCLILFGLTAIYLWMFHGLKGMPIFWSGTFAALFARSMWWLVYGRKLESDQRFDVNSEESN